MKRDEVLTSSGSEGADWHRGVLTFPAAKPAYASASPQSTIRSAAAVVVTE